MGNIERSRAAEGAQLAFHLHPLRATAYEGHRHSSHSEPEKDHEEESTGDTVELHEDAEIGAQLPERPILAAQNEEDETPHLDISA
jgi:hypothetical protein